MQSRFTFPEGECYSVDGVTWRDTPEGAWAAWIALEERAMIPAAHRCRDSECRTWH